MDALQAYDLGLLYFFGSLHRPWLDPLVMTWTHLGDKLVLTPFTLLCALAFRALGQRREAVAIVLIGLAALGVEYGTKLLVGRPRPVVAWQLIDPPREPSFPSGHAFVSIALYGGAALLAARRMQRSWPRRLLIAGGIVLGMSVGLTRPYLGVHYPLDVFAGWIGGLGVALVGVSLVERTSP